MIGLSVSIQINVIWFRIQAGLVRTHAGSNIAFLISYRLNPPKATSSTRDHAPTSTSIMTDTVAASTL